MRGVYKRNSPDETKRKLQILKQLQAQSFKNKINIANDIIIKSFAIGKTALLYSGGKDSTVLLDMLLKHDKNILIIHNNTTLGSKEYINNLRKSVVGLNYIETISDDPVTMWNERGHYPLLSKRGFTAYKKKYPDLRISPVQCCYQLKEKYSNKVLNDNEVKVVFWGLRAGESNRRKLTFVDNGFLFKPKKYKWYQSCPLSHFTDIDINMYLSRYIPSYNDNSKLETGCLCCGTDITYKDNNLNKLFRSDRNKWEYYMFNGFAKQILMIKGISDINDNLISDIIKNRPQILLKV